MTDEETYNWGSIEDMMYSLADIFHRQMSEETMDMYRTALADMELVDILKAGKLAAFVEREFPPIAVFRWLFMITGSVRKIDKEGVNIIQ